MESVIFREIEVEGFTVAYREAGLKDAQTLLLLHGFPSKRHMFRKLIPLPSDQFHIVAPDLPGLGQSDLPSSTGFTYSLDNIARVIGRFTEALRLDRSIVYVFDYGAPTGFCLALRHPERVTAIISQNGNAYKEGLSDGWNPIRAYWNDASEKTARLCARSSTQRPRFGSIRTACPRVRRNASHRTATHWITTISHVPIQTRPISTYSETTRATWPSIRISKATSALTNRHS